MSTYIFASRIQLSFGVKDSEACRPPVLSNTFWQPAIFRERIETLAVIESNSRIGAGRRCVTPAGTPSRRFRNSMSCKKLRSRLPDLLILQFKFDSNDIPLRLIWQ